MPLLWDFHIILAELLLEFCKGSRSSAVTLTWGNPFQCFFDTPFWLIVCCGKDLIFFILEWHHWGRNWLATLRMIYISIFGRSGRVGSQLECFKVPSYQSIKHQSQLVRVACMNHIYLFRSSGPFLSNTNYCL